MLTTSASAGESLEGCACGGGMVLFRNMAQKDDVLFTEHGLYRTRLAQVFGTQKTWQLHERVQGRYVFMSQRIDVPGTATIGDVDTLLKGQIVLGTHIARYNVDGAQYRIRLAQTQSNNANRVWQAHEYLNGWVFRSQWIEAASSTLAQVATQLLGV